MNNSLQEMLKSRMVRAVLILLAAFLLAETISTFRGVERSGIPATDTITVQGAGEATLAPDVARITFSVQHTAATVAEAQTATTKQANAALEYVKGQHVDEKDIKTLSYNISPQYSYPKNPYIPMDGSDYYSAPPKITGYEVSETIQVTVRDLKSVGEMLGGLGKLEVQNINGPAFALDDSTAGYAAARADAINKAKVEAKLLAKQLGVHLGKIVNFSESSGGYGYPMMYAKTDAMGMSVSERAPTPDVPAGENSYNASVSITYEIR
jgi:uncharacterized protein YggE